MRHPATTTAGARGARDRESDCHGYDESGDQFNESHDDASQFAMNELPKNAGVIAIRVQGVGWPNLIPWS
jgi:hypothetical protein